MHRNRLVLVSTVLGVLAVAEVLQGATFVVAPNGKDTNPGTAEQPLATLEAARDAARKSKDGPHCIKVMPGEYFLAKPLELDARDNGLTIEAGPGGAVTLYGGQLVTAWRRDGDRLWCADLPGVKEGTWDFRALVVNGRMPDRARFPESGTLLNQGTWNLPLLPAVGGFWERKPTKEELTTMPYDPKDIPATLDVKNAEVRVYHMWDESLVGVDRNDTQRHALIFSSPMIWPAGALNLKKYVIYNTREGMTQPGQWYLDRTAGRIVYWPLPGEDMAQAKVIAPKLERIIRIAGTAKSKAEKITLRGLTLQATTVPLKPASFGAGGFDGALSIAEAQSCTIEGLEICNVGGLAIVARQLANSQMVQCHVHDVGACGVKLDGSETLIRGNHIHHVGIYYPSAAASMFGGRALRICRNEVHDSPYSGVIGGGKDHLFEENLIYRVMREMHDGAAIYGNLANCTIRRNVVRDIVEVGKGFGVSAYYLDEGAHDCIVERNVSVGVGRPTHNHIARNVTIRDNVFIVDKDMQLSFQKSANCTFERNTLVAPGKVTVGQPNAVKVWKDNILFSSGLGKNDQAQPFTITDAMPPVATPGRKTYAAEAGRVTKAPTLDGEITLEEWPGRIQSLDRDPSRQLACGAPVFVKFSYDDQFLYVAATVTMFEPAKLSTEATWGKDDGAEICLAGKTPDGKPAAFVVRGYVNGAVQSVVEGGVSSEAATRLGKDLRFAAKIIKGPSGKPKGWRGEWVIPLAALGLKPTSGEKIAFNMGAYISEFGEWHCWEGTLAENWRLDQAGTLRFK
ncbi:MAG: right-handed parallel beta-helix repeat-containing protein [Thermoguttaceae bacterium]